MERPRLAVLGSPIEHSLSPRLHGAAYVVLGLDWSYEAVEVTAERLAEHLSALGPEWRGLSLTMPLKRQVVPLLDATDELVRLTGVCNTVVLTPSGRSGYNTDVYGIVAAFRDHGVNSLEHMAVLGGGATASSALVAGHRMGVRSAQFWVRNPDRASNIRELAASLGVQAEIRAFTDPGSAGEFPDAVVSTLPNGALVELDLPQELLRQSVLFDVAYDPWPTHLASAWQREGGRVISGIDMLINQALAQVRIFVGGSVDSALPLEESVLRAMRASVGA